jgi:hypothetical protein
MTPRKVSMSTAMKPIIREMRPPYMMRVRRSMPLPSVPSGWAAEGASYCRVTRELSVQRMVHCRSRRSMARVRAVPSASVYRTRISVGDQLAHVGLEVQTQEDVGVDRLDDIAGKLGVLRFFSRPRGYRSWRCRRRNTCGSRCRGGILDVLGSGVLERAKGDVGIVGEGEAVRGFGACVIKNLVTRPGQKLGDAGGGAFLAAQDGVVHAS